MDLKFILVANHNLINAGGTESYTFAIIEELIKRGYQVEYFTFNKGVYSGKIERDLGVRFMSRKKYDLILANHYACINYLFRKGIIIQTSHGIFHKKEQPSRFANAYVSISEEVAEHLKAKGKESTIIYNSVNTCKFNIQHKLHPTLETVLSLCHSDEANGLIKRSCDLLGIAFIEQSKYRNPIWKMEDLINKADLVVGLGRSAFEAMACGRPIIVFDHRHYFYACGDGYIRDSVEDSLRFNCSGRFKRKQFTQLEFAGELLKYNAKDGLFFREFALQNLNIEINIQKYLSIAAGYKVNRSYSPGTRCLNYLLSCWFFVFYNIKYKVLRQD